MFLLTKGAFKVFWGKAILLKNNLELGNNCFLWVSFYRALGLANMVNKYELYQRCLCIMISYSELNIS